MSEASRFVLIDISNSFTKVARSTREKIGRVKRIETELLNPQSLLEAIGKGPFDLIVMSSVVPRRERVVRRTFRDVPVITVSPRVELGVGIDYPKPDTIGADRLANAVGAVEAFGAPCIVVDFGTAVTFDVISPAREYIGGVIAPGLAAMTDYLHERTALLPRIDLAEPRSAVGKSTRDAMLSGAVHGYRGLVREILREVRRSEFPRRRCAVVATGGYAALIADEMDEIDCVEPLLTLDGLRIIGTLNA